MLSLNFQGYEIGATGHDLSEAHLKQLQSLDLNLSSICQVVDNYDPWSTNHFDIAGPLVDDSLLIQVYDLQERCIWSGTHEALLSLDDHAEKYPKVLEIEAWDEPRQSGDALACKKHPRILYYEELNKGDVVGQCRIDAGSFDPLDLSIVQGCIETPKCDWYYVSRVIYKGRLLDLEPLAYELHNIRTSIHLVHG